MFDGHFTRKAVNLSGRSGKNESHLPRDEFVKRKKQERLKRERQRLEQESSLVIQKIWRGQVDIRRARVDERKLFDKRLGDIEKVLTLIARMPPGAEDKFRDTTVMSLARQINFFYSPRNALDKQRLQKVITMLKKMTHLEEPDVRIRMAHLLYCAMRYHPSLVMPFVSGTDPIRWRELLPLLKWDVVCTFLRSINDHAAWVFFLPLKNVERQRDYIGSHIQTPNINIMWALEVINSHNLEPPTWTLTAESATLAFQNFSSMSAGDIMGADLLESALPWIIWAKQTISRDEALVFFQKFETVDLLRHYVGGTPKGLQNILKLFFEDPNNPIISTQGLQTLAFSTPFLSLALPVIRSQKSDQWKSLEDPDAESLFVAFSMVFITMLGAMDDIEFQAKWASNELRDAIHIILELTTYWILHLPEPRDYNRVTQLAKLLRALFDRHLRQELLTDWVIPNFNTTRMTPEQYEIFLELIPFAVPFQMRVAHYTDLVLRAQGARNFDPWSDRFGVRRQYILEDGFKVFDKLDDNLRGNLRIEFIDNDGRAESGIDGGGLFKEFLLHLCRVAFDPIRGLFTETHDKRLVPNPNAKNYYDNHLALFHFLGKVIGKAMYEMVLIEPQFGHTFLNLILGKSNSLDNLQQMDPELFRSLHQLKDMDVNELDLTFSVTNTEMSMMEEVDLIPNGRNISVTNENKIKYIHYVSNYRTNTQCAKECNAFLGGLQKAVDLQWLHMFDPYELNILISGTNEGFEVEDLKRNTVYAGGFDEDSDVVRWFWSLLERESMEFRARFLMFVTSCSRGPLLGFKNLYPRFCIHRVPDNDRLPTASTCINLLKLPDYINEERLVTKLTQAIAVDQGFHLS